MNTSSTRPGAGRNDHIHGDEHLPPELTPAEQSQIAARAAELIDVRLSEQWRFCDLMSGLDLHSYESFLHAMFLHAANSRSGDPVAIGHVLAAVWQFAAVVQAEAEIIWRAECEALAEREL